MSFDQCAIFCRINDRVISANNVSLEGVDYATAVQVLRDSGQSVNLVVKRRVILPPTIPASMAILGNSNLEQPRYLNVALQRLKKKEDFGIVLGCKIYVKEIIAKTAADKDGILQVGDELTKINGCNVDALNLKEARKVLEASKDKVELTVRRPGSNVNAGDQHKNNLMRNGFGSSTPPRPPLPSGLTSFNY